MTQEEIQKKIGEDIALRQLVSKLEAARDWIRIGAELVSYETTTGVRDLDRGLDELSDVIRQLEAKLK